MRPGRGVSRVSTFPEELSGSAAIETQWEGICIRQFQRQETPQVPGMEISPRHDVGHQVPAAAEHRGCTDRRMRLEKCFDLAEFDAIPANLHLRVAPSEIFDVPSGS